MLDEYPILVKPVYDLSGDGDIQTCFNCGGNVFRLKNEYWENIPSIKELSVICAICGEIVCGYSFPEIEEDNLTES